MSEFKGKQGKLSIEVIKEDFYVTIINEKGSSVAGISTYEEYFEEAIVYGNLFARAPEMLEMLEQTAKHLKETQGNSGILEDIQQLIQKATKI